ALFPPGALRDAAHYALFPGGKRLRPRLALIFGEAFGVPMPRLLDFACAVEMIHNYTLVHDDLPAMDNDDLRRGRPTVHKKFEESTAILLGDALLTQAFELLALAGNAKAMACVARCAGAKGVVWGQVLDLGPKKRSGGKNDKEFKTIYELKTAKLFEAAILGAVLLARKPPSPVQVKNLQNFSKYFGLAFQIADDLADAKESHGKDIPTLVKTIGLVTAKEELAACWVKLEGALAKLRLTADTLQKLDPILSVIKN
ncbi:MAG: polyprenyl synthetase family protein, partial [Elusimicrobiota bacterium]